MNKAEINTTLAGVEGIVWHHLSSGNMVATCSCGASYEYQNEQDYADWRYEHRNVTDYTTSLDPCDRVADILCVEVQIDHTTSTSRIVINAKNGDVLEIEYIYEGKTSAQVLAGMLAEIVKERQGE